MTGPRILTAAESELLTTDIDVWLENEDCPCAGVCTCEQNDPP